MMHLPCDKWASHVAIGIVLTHEFLTTSSSCAAKTLALEELVAEQADNGEFKPLMCIRGRRALGGKWSVHTAD